MMGTHIIAFESDGSLFHSKVIFLILS